MKLAHAAVMAGLALGLMSGAAKASYVLTLTQDSLGVTATGVGSFDTDLLSDSGTGSQSSSKIIPRYGFFDFNSPEGQTNSVELYSGNFVPVNGSGTFGPGLGGSAQSSAGDIAGFDYIDGDVVTPLQYTSGTTLTSSMFFGGATFSSLGLTPGTYSYTYGDEVSSAELFRRDALALDTITVNVGVNGPSPVPLPASAPMFGAAILALGAVGYGLKRKGKAAAA